MKKHEISTENAPKAIGPYSQEVNKIYAEFFKEPYPARACVEVSALPKNAQVEIELIAHPDEKN